MSNLLNTTPIDDSPILHECHAWYTKDFLSIFNTPENNALWVNEAINKLKTLDFLVIPGKVSCKVQAINEPPVKVEIIFNEIDPETWEKIISTLASHIYYVAKLSIGEVPQELVQVYEEHNTHFVSQNIEDLKFLQNGVEIKKLDFYTIVVIKKLVERFEEDPFLIFLLRGCGPKELIAGIRKFRNNLQGTHLKQLKEQAKDAEIKNNGFVRKSEIEVTREQIEHFLENIDFSAKRYWRWGEDMEKLKYSIKADDLPASILKRLDPLPIDTLESKVSSLLEDAYAHTTRRAQSFGLGL
ncbi:MAG: hypothetical protein LBE20_06905 [Deltaproteobacteria bacterium]|nr:hypothetical protein [Deltaproteobacteria bacterium]